MLIYENDSCRAFASTDLIQERKSGIGGSDIGAICGLDPFRSPLDVYCEKRGLTESIPDNEFLKWGRTLEPIIAQEFLTRSGTCGVGNLFLRSKAADYLIVHPDRMIHPHFEQNFMGVLECKNVGLRNSRGWTEREIPERVFLQVQYALMISGLSKGWVAALIDGNDYRLYDIAADEEIFERVRSLAAIFWERVRSGDAPAPTARERDAELIKRIYPRSVAETITVIDESPLARDLVGLAAARNEAEATAMKVIEFENRIKAAMGEKDTVLFPAESIKVTWRQSKDSVVIDWKAVAAAAGASAELIAKHSSVRIGARRFLFSQEKGDGNGGK